MNKLSYKCILPYRWRLKSLCSSDNYSIRVHICSTLFYFYCISVQFRKTIFGSHKVFDIISLVMYNIFLQVKNSFVELYNNTMKIQSFTNVSYTVITRRTENFRSLEHWVFLLRGKR